MNGEVRLLILILVFTLLATCSRPSEPNSVQPQRLFAFDQPIWFEDAAARFMVTPDGKFAVYESNRPQWIDLSTGIIDTDHLRRGLDAVTAAVMQSNGSVLRRGRLGKQQGWFLPGEPLRLSELPANAIFPQWSPDNSSVAYEVAGGKLFLGAAKDAKPVDGLEGVEAIAWSPDSKYIYATTTNTETGLVALYQIAATDRRAQAVAKDLDGFSSRIALDSTGSKAYLSLVSATPWKRLDSAMILTLVAASAFTKSISNPDRSTAGCKPIVTSLLLSLQAHTSIGPGMPSTIPSSLCQAEEAKSGSLPTMHLHRVGTKREHKSAL